MVRRNVVRCLSFSIWLVFCGLSTSTSEGQAQDLLKVERSLSLDFSSHREDSLLLRQFARQQYNITPSFVLTVPVNNSTDLAVLLLLIQTGTRPRPLLKSWLTLEARTVIGHRLHLDMKYLSQNNSLLNLPTLAIQLDKTRPKQEVTVYFQPHKEIITVFLDCEELINRELHLRRPSLRRYSTMQLLEVSRQVVHTATPTARLSPEVDVVCGSVWAQGGRVLFTRQLSNFPETRSSSDKSSQMFGQWAEWTEWSTCSTSCGIGSHTRERLCLPPSHTFKRSPMVLKCLGNRLDKRFCIHKEKCPNLSSVLPVQFSNICCEASKNGLVKPFMVAKMSIRPDCAHVLVEDCSTWRFRISAVWERCGVGQCIVSIIVYDVGVGQVLVTRDHHVYANGQPIDISSPDPRGINFTLVVFRFSCGVRLFGLKGYDVCYNGTTGNVTVEINRNTFTGQTCGLCGPVEHVASALENPTPNLSNSPDGTTVQTRTSGVVDRNMPFKLLSWKCDPCHYDGAFNKATLQAQLACDKGINSAVFRRCREHLSVRELHAMLNRCKDRVCRCPKSYQKECLCNAVAEFAILCGKMGIIVDWRSDQFCKRDCGDGSKKYKDWGCSMTCKDVAAGKDPSRCPASNYTSGCHCRFRNWVLLTGDLDKSRCEMRHRCPCPIDGGSLKLSHGVSTELDGRNCTCFSGSLRCGPPKPFIVNGSNQVIYARRGFPVTVLCKTLPSNRTANVTLVGPAPANKTNVGTGEALINISALDINANIGMYNCKAKNSVGSVKAQIEVKETVPPVIQSISPSQTVPEYSPDIAINCEVSGHPVPDPTITWTLNGRSLQAGHGVTIKDKKDKDITTWRLKISQLLRNYSGIYTCRASNAGGSSHLSTLVTVILSHSGLLRFLSKPSDRSVAMSSSIVRLPCSAIGNPHPSVEWFKDGERVVVDNTQKKTAKLVIKDVKLVIKDVVRANGGLYECRAYSGDNMIRSSAFLTIYDYDWSEWSSWSACSASCGEHAISTRRRSCYTLPCYGPAREERNCTVKRCSGTCYTWGNFHAVMLDGRISYSFRGECEYILAEECPRKPKPAFSVRQEMKLCHSVDQCSKEVRIFLGEKRTDYILSSNSVTAARSDRIRKLTLPHRNRGVNITNDGVFVTFRTDGLTVRYDRHSRVYVTIGQQYRNRTCGLCGNTTGTDDDDDIFRRNREMTASGTQFAQQWATGTDARISQCKTLPAQTIPCSQDAEDEAQLHCSAFLKDSRFFPCHDALHPQQFYQLCRRQVCECPQEMTRVDCSCGAYTSYVAICSQLGIHIQWDNKAACYSKCADNTSVLTECRASEQLACFDKNTRNKRRNTRVSRCQQFAGPGCYCPEGTVLHNDRCVYKTDCPCSHQAHLDLQRLSLVWTDDCSKRTCLGASLLPTNSSCPEAKSLLLTNTSPSSVLPSPDIVVVTTTPNSVAVVKDKAFQLCCNTVHGMGRTSPRYQWFHNGVRIPGESGPSTSQRNPGRYRCQAEGSGLVSKESTVMTYAAGVSSCLQTPLDKWVVLPRDCQHATTRESRINVGQCSGLPCITAYDSATVVCRDTETCCGVSEWKSVAVTCSGSSIARFTVVTAAQCGCIRCPQQRATVYGTVRWAHNGSSLPYATMQLQGVDDRVQAHVLDGLYEVDTSLNLDYLAVKFFRPLRTPAGQFHYPPIVKALPLGYGRRIAYHVRLLMPTVSQRVDCRSSTQLTLSPMDSNSNELFPLQTSLFIGRDSFRNKDGSVCSGSVTVRVTYITAQDPLLAAESPGVFQYADADGSFGLIKPLFVAIFTAVDSDESPVDMIRPVRFHIYSLLENVVTSTLPPPSQGKGKSLDFFALSQTAALWTTHTQMMTVRESEYVNRNHSAMGLLNRTDQAYAIGRKMKACYARVGAVNAVGSRIGGILVTVQVVYETPYMTSTSRWVTEHNGQKCVPIACHHQAILSAVQSWNTQSPIRLSPFGRRNDSTNVTYHKNDAIYVVSSAPLHPPLYPSLDTCQGASWTAGEFLFVLPDLMSSFTAVEQEGIAVPTAWRPAPNEAYYFVKVKVIGHQKEYAVRASTYSVENDGYILYGWRQERVAADENRESYVCLEFTFPTQFGASRNNTVVVIDIYDPYVEAGEGRHVCKRQLFSPFLQVNGSPSTVLLQDAKEYEFKFLPPVEQFGSSVGVFSDSLRRQAEVDCINSSPEPGSGTWDASKRTETDAAVVFKCLE